MGRKPRGESLYLLVVQWGKPYNRTVHYRPQQGKTYVASPTRNALPGNSARENLSSITLNSCCFSLELSLRTLPRSSSSSRRLTSSPWSKAGLVYGFAVAYMPRIAILLLSNKHSPPPPAFFSGKIMGFYF